MTALRLLVLLPLLLGLSPSVTSSCSYLDLMQHLNLTPSSDVLQVMRPVRDWTRPTQVMLDMLVYGFLQVDEKFQTITSHVWVQMAWWNDFTQWNPSSFCGINTVTIPRSRLWIPDINIQEDTSDSGSVQVGPHLSLLSTGLVISTLRQRLTTTCQFNLSLFPFDTQTCSITFRSMGSSAKSLLLDSFNNDSTLYRLSTQSMVTRGEWKLEDLEVTPFIENSSHAPESKLAYSFTIRRKPMLYVINFIVPLLYFLILDLASFFISEARGEKLSFKVTLLLSISVLLLMLQDMLPSTEETLPMIANYCVAIFVLVGISVLEVMLISCLVDLDSETFCRSTEKPDGAVVEIQMEEDHLKEAAAAEDGDQVKTQVQTPHHPLDLGLHGLLRRILEEVQAARQETVKPEKETKRPGKFRRVAEVVDCVFFFCYLTTVIVFIYFMYDHWVKFYTMNI